MATNGLERRLRLLEGRFRPALVEAVQADLLEPARETARALGVDEEALVHGVRCMALTIQSDRAAGLSERQIASSLHLTWLGLRTGVAEAVPVRLAVEMADQLASR